MWLQNMKVIELSDREAQVFQKWLISQEVRYSNEHQHDTITPIYHVEIDVVISVMEQLENQGVES